MNDMYLIIAAALVVLAFILGSKQNMGNFNLLEVKARKNGKLLYKKAMITWANKNGVRIDEYAVDDIYETLLEEQTRNCETTKNSLI